MNFQYAFNTPQQRSNRKIKSFDNVWKLVSKTQRNNEINFRSNAYPVLKKKIYKNENVGNYFIDFGTNVFH